MRVTMEPTLFFDPQAQPRTHLCPRCGSCTYPPGYHCPRCDREDAP